MNFVNALGICVMALGLACGALWKLYRAADARADRAEKALEVEAANAKIVTKYVDRIVKVPGPAVVRERLVRGLCEPAEGLPGAGRADAAAGGDAGDRPADAASRLAADLPACRRNRMKLEALQEVLRPQL